MLWFAWAALSSPAALVVCWLDYWWTGPAASDDRTGPALTRAVAGNVRVRRGLPEGQLQRLQTVAQRGGVDAEVLRRRPDHLDRWHLRQVPGLVADFRRVRRGHGANLGTVRALPRRSPAVLDSGATLCGRPAEQFAPELSAASGGSASHPLDPQGRG